MTTLTPKIASDVVACCRAAADEIVACLTRGLDAEFMGVTIGEATKLDPAQQPADLSGPGLAMVFNFGDSAAAAFLPEASGLVPSWYVQPDAAGKNKLIALAQELSTLLMPASMPADDILAFRVDQIGSALTRAKVAPDAALVPMSLKCGDKNGQMSFIWPIVNPAELKPKSVIPEVPRIEPTLLITPPEPEIAVETSTLPKHTRSLFKVRVPVSVVLATQKQSVEDIISLVPGAIIKFEKSCDELVELVVGDQTIAAGEVVKVGDKFGLRIRDMIQPQEQFVAIKATMLS